MKSQPNNFEFQECSDDDIWDAYLIDSTQQNLFLTSKYLRLNGLEKSRYIVLDKNQFALGCVLDTSLFHDKTRKRDIFSCYENIFYKQFKNMENYRTDLKKTEYLEFIANILISNRWEVKLSLHHSLLDIRGLVWPFYDALDMKIEVQSKYTGIIELGFFSSFEEYLQSIRKVRTQEYYKIKSNSELIEAGEVEVEFFLEMYKKTFEKNTILVRESEIERIREIIKSGLSTCSGKLYLLKDETGQYISGIYYERYLSSFYYLFGANDPESLNLHGSTFLILHMVNEAFQNGMQFVDMVGMNSPNRGNFKATFNARPKLYFELESVIIK